MRLAKLIKSSEILNSSDLDQKTPGWRDLEVRGISLDSRDIRDGYLYAAIRGLKSDGHDYLEQVQAAGASFALVERIVADVDLIQLQVENVRFSLGPICAAFYGTSPDDGVMYAAVSGTDGKTSTNQLITYLMESSRMTVGRIGTPGITYTGYSSEQGSHTTPNSTALHAYNA